MFDVSIEADGLNGDDSSDDELPLVRKLLSPATPSHGTLPALIPPTRPSRRPGAQQGHLQTLRLLRADLCSITLNGRSFIRPIKETVRVGRCSPIPLQAAS
jgi:hypothetical protein